MISTMFELAPS